MDDRGWEEFLRSTIVAAGGVLRSVADSGAAPGPDADRLVSRFITAAIARTFPGHCYLSEEEKVPEPRTGTPTWIIDPIDGSENFYRGLLAYTISISLVCGEDILLGAVYEPYVDRLFFAARGKGARLNDRPIQVSRRSNPADAVIAVSRYTSFARNGDGPLFANLAHAMDVRISSSTALDMCHVAAGAIEGRVMADTRAWDNSAATLLVREAGGMVTDWAGGPAVRSSSKLVASNGACHDAILEHLHGR